MKINDDNLIRALKMQDSMAIEYIIDRYGALIKSVLLRNLCEYGERWEECFNDVLLAIWTHPERFEAAQGRVALDDSQWASIVDESVALYDVDGRGSLEELQKLLHCLSPEDQELFMRRYGLQQPVTQISAETGMHVFRCAGGTSEPR